MTPAPTTPTRSEFFASAFTSDADTLEPIPSTPVIFSSRSSRPPPSTSPQLWRTRRSAPGHDWIQKVTRIRDQPIRRKQIGKSPGPCNQADRSRTLVIVLDADDVVLAEVASG